MNEIFDHSPFEELNIKFFQTKKISSIIMQILISRSILSTKLVLISFRLLFIHPYAPYILIITVSAALKVISRIFLGFLVTKTNNFANYVLSKSEKPPNRQCGGFGWFLGIFRLFLGCFDSYIAILGSFWAFKAVFGLFWQLCSGFPPHWRFFKIFIIHNLYNYQAR